ncbi:MAG: 30S ribosomal protein S7 [bacterium]|jgi:small subunit ribosomal protein S7|nr:30S ribosomal protein S7 [bacterium]
MSRGAKIRKKPIETDAIYKSRVVTRTINKVMLHGKKSIARSVVYSVIENLTTPENEGVKLFEDAIRNIMPKVEVRSRRVGGSNYQVPVPLKHDRSESLAVRWLVDAARSKKGMDMNKALLTEVQAAILNEGDAVRKKDTVQKMADANKAFAHFKW